jgi:FkbM family methyltransferase
VFSRLQSHVVAGPFREVSTTWNLGLGSEDGQVTLWGSDELLIHGARNDGLTSAFADSLRTTVVGQMVVKRFDDLVKGRLDVVKIDCEGSELAALRGMEDALREFTPRLLIEMNPATFAAAGYDGEEVLAYLETFGYSSYRVGHLGALVPVDVKEGPSATSWTLVALGPSAAVARTSRP